MSRWLRLYDELLDDPKVQLLSAEDFKGYINLLCLASRSGGRLPNMADVSYALRRPLNDAETLVSRLKNATLIDTRNGGANGSHYAIHGWDKRQFKSDISTDRVKRFRERQGTLFETPPDSETESETESAQAREDSIGSKRKKTKLTVQCEIDGEETIMRTVREELVAAIGAPSYAPFCDPARPITFVSEEGRLVAFCCDGLAHSRVRDHEYRLSVIAKQHGYSGAWIRERPKGVES